MIAQSVSVEPIAGALGAEISGVDLAKPLAEETVAAIRRAWLAHGVIFFRDQDLPPAAFLTFARRFGEPIEYPFVKGLPEHPEIIPVLKLAEERVNFGGIWHSDTAYLDVPPMASMLIAREVPPAGGDTLFASMYLAYEALSDGMKRLLDGLSGVNSSASADVSKTREDRMKDRGRADARQEYVASHPIVRTHPETGRKCIFLGDHAWYVQDMPFDEGRQLIEELNAAIIDPERVYTHRWRPGDLLIWDNRCMLHKAEPYDVASEARVMRRCTVVGEVPI
jgi:taurine dioxygenase